MEAEASGGEGYHNQFPHLTRFFSLKGFTGGTPVLPNNEASRMTPNAKVLTLYVLSLELGKGYIISGNHRRDACDSASSMINAKVLFLQLSLLSVIIGHKHFIRAGEL
jgi:hypothetical protein